MKKIILFYVLILGIQMQAQYLKALSTITSLIKHEDILKKLENCTSEADIEQTLREASA